MFSGNDVWYYLCLLPNPCFTTSEIASNAAKSRALSPIRSLTLNACLATIPDHILSPPNIKKHTHSIEEPELSTKSSR